MLEMPMTALQTRRHVMNSSAATIAQHPFVRFVSCVLYGVVLAMFGGYLGFSHGWDAALNAQPQEVYVRFECEPPTAI